MSNAELFQKVRELQLPIGKYALFGSAPLGIRGLKDCHDVDIIVTEDLWRKCKNNGWELKIMPHAGPYPDEFYLENQGIELWRNWRPGEWDIDSLIREAEIIGGLPFIQIDKVLAWKKLSGRDKDFKDAAVIEEFLDNQ
ncbi:MAG: hypothetical protein M1361_00830 [Patescibacteria group bacterium]|nr:hypothetical protein [Patescibacteria group bacterium]MCL5224155.1 hypothetical protein [Patescibacteria group bacterium]